MEEYGYICREKWIDLNCGHDEAGVICQEQEVSVIAKGRYLDNRDAAFT